MTWKDTAEGAAGALTVATIVLPVAWRVARPWLIEVESNLRAAKHNTAQLQVETQTLKENGGASLKDKANVAAESSLRTEQAVARIEAAQLKITEQFTQFLIQDAGKEARTELRLEILERERQH